MKDFDEKQYTHKKVLILQDDSTTGGSKTEALIALLASVDASVYVVTRPYSSLSGVLEKNPQIKGVIQFEGNWEIKKLLPKLRAMKFDTAILYLPSDRFEKYIPYVIFFSLLGVPSKAVVIQHGEKMKILSRISYVCKFFHATLPYSGFILSMPFAYIRNSLKKNRKIRPLDIKKILFVRLDRIGDVVVAGSVIDSLCMQFPNAQIDVLVGPWAEDLFSHDPRIHRVYTFSAPWYSQQSYAGYQQEDFKSLIRQLHKEKYSLAVESHGKIRDSWIAYMSGAKFVAGTSRPLPAKSLGIPNSIFLTHSADYGTQPHLAIIQHTNLMRVLGYDAPMMLTPKLIVHESVSKKVSYNLLPQHKFSIAVHLSSVDPRKIWPEEYFIKTMELLNGSQDRDIAYYLIGSPSESEHLSSLVQVLTERGISAYNTAGKYSLSELIAFFSHMDLFLGNDSGPMHMAVASGAPVIAFFLPENAALYAPQAERHTVLIPAKGEDLTSISPESVVTLIETRMEEKYL